MNRTESALLSLLQAGIWMTIPAKKEHFPLTEEEWTEVFEQSKKQTISALVLQGINMLDEDMMPPMSLLQRWAINVDRTEKENKKHKKAQAEVIEWLEGLDIHPKVLKGQGAAAMYNDPTQRACGDIDLFFPTPGDQQKAWMAASDRGLRPKRVPLGAFNFEWDGVEIECHKRMLDISNPFCNRHIQKLVINEAKEDGIYPTPMTTLLLLNTHILKHMLSHGIGLRQFADMARAYHTLRGQYDEAEYLDWCRRLHIEKWTRELNLFLERNLGTPVEDLPRINKKSLQQEYILKKVMNGGNFGFYASTRASHTNSRLKKRLYTLLAITKEWRYTLHLAPSESIWMVIQLMKGDR